MVRAELGRLPTLLKIGFAELSAYRAEVFIWILTTMMPLIMFAMWSTIAREGPIGRFDEATFAAYFLSTLIVRQLSAAWIVWELNWLIRSGALAPTLLKPIHPLQYYAAQNFAAIPFRAVILAPIVAVTLFFFPSLPVELSAGRLALYATTILLAWLLTFMVQAMMGLLALYTQQSLAFQEAWFGVWALLSGYLIPLELLPGLQSVAIWLPFRAMGSMPTEILLGHLDEAALAQAIGAQLGWLLVTFILLRVAWRRSIRRFEAYGG